MKGLKAKHRLYYCLIVIILLPVIQYYTQIIESKGLEYVPTRNDTVFSANTWFDGSYQRKKSEYLNDVFGFRPDFIRLDCQLDFWLFKKLHNSVYVGHDNYLFDKGSIDEYIGANFMGDDLITNALWKLKRIQDTFAKLGKTIVVVYPPSKPYLFPEKIPKRLLPGDGPVKTNYRECVRIGDSLKLHQIDLASWLKATNDTDRCSIIGKRGLHWTLYGALLAADTLIKYIEQDRKITMPEIKITAIRRTDSPHRRDDNMYFNANLIFPEKKEMEIKADYHYVSNKNSKKPNIIYIGDSFIWYMADDGLMEHTNTDWQYWFYFYRIFDKTNISDPGCNHYLTDTDWLNTVINSDGFVVLWVSFNLVNLTVPGRFDKIYDYYYPAIRK